MKIVGIGDSLIPENYIKEGFKNFEEQGVKVETIQWRLESYKELQNINLMVETGGSEAYEPPKYIFDAVKDADIIITQFCPITKKLIDYCDNLKAVGVLRGGYENINFQYADEKGIIVFNTPGRNANAVADFTVGLLISECRNISKSHLNLKDGKWVRDYTNADSVPDLADKIVGIIGFGEIGRKVAKRLAGFDMKIVSYDPFFRGKVLDVEMVTLEKLMRISDFVTLHARLTKDTEGLINKDLLSLMKPTAYLINSARSGLIDEKALYDALKNKKIIGAALDVFDEEPPSKEYPLLTLENITVTPHLAGGTKDAFTNSPKLLAAEMIKVLTGVKSRYVVNKDTYSENTNSCRKL
ncbi:2-hydroxyacid dehydrogenase [Clostridium algoriphilum]|uniref:2-hydroxyacid dehydrogenase n=1 Tax=Clostridium algoriphilum TaxID=198347 RepID=UPI001CF5F1D9|nr:2-hydroxyacid dehydrogenase [Clostridium algoriphilum]MCB2293620.1 2-hydroxyacid dehydrogenase [Clostridium algoriphilum]